VNKKENKMPEKILAIVAFAAFSILFIALMTAINSRGERRGNKPPRWYWRWSIQWDLQIGSRWPFIQFSASAVSPFAPSPNRGYVLQIPKLRWWQFLAKRKRKKAEEKLKQPFEGEPEPVMAYDPDNNLNDSIAFAMANMQNARVSCVKCGRQLSAPIKMQIHDEFVWEAEPCPACSEASDET
jgi:hypothetical protein